MISPEALHTELTRVEVALKKILGIKPKFFRPPYGSYNAAALQVLEERGYHSKLSCIVIYQLRTALTMPLLCSDHVVDGLGRLNGSAGRIFSRSVRTTSS